MQDKQSGEVKLVGNYYIPPESEGHGIYLGSGVGQTEWVDNYYLPESEGSKQQGDYRPYIWWEHHMIGMIGMGWPHNLKGWLQLAWNWDMFYGRVPFCKSLVVILLIIDLLLVLR